MPRSTRVTENEKQVICKSFVDWDTTFEDCKTHLVAADTSIAKDARIKIKGITIRSVKANSYRNKRHAGWLALPGRDKTLCIWNVTSDSNLSGVLHIEPDASNEWKMTLKKRLQSSGLDLGNVTNEH